MEKVSLETLRGLSGYVFHGSATFTNKLAPKQPTKINRTTGKKVFDGEPAVAATPYIDLAVFRSIINPTNIKITHRSSFGLTDRGEMHFAVSPGVLEYARGHKATGYVYALAKGLFSMHSPKEVRSKSPRRLEYYAVSSYNDLPSDIQDEAI